MVIQEKMGLRRERGPLLLKNACTCVILLSIFTASPNVFAHGGGGLPDAKEAAEQVAAIHATGEHQQDLSAQVAAIYGTPCSEARRGPSALALLGVGAAVSPLVYLMGVAWHEGSHAGMATVFGGKVTGINILPSIYEGHLRFGQTNWQGNFNSTQTALVSIAPKFTDATILGSYALVLETGNMPANKWAQLGFTALAVGALVDFSKDMFATWDQADIPTFYRNAGITNTAPFRLLHAGLAGAGAFEVGRGMYKLFTPDKNVLKPVPKPQSKRPSAFDIAVHPYLGTETLGLEGTF